MADRPPILRQAVSRRLALRGATALGAAILLPRAGWADEPHHDHMSATLGVVPRPVVPALGQPLVEPEVRRSVDGVLNTSMSMRYAWRNLGGFRLYMRSYEGGAPGPTLRLKPGEVLKLRLANEFPPNRDFLPADIGIPHQFNNTNFHFHGAHCSPSGIADNVMRSMVPGEAYDVEIALPQDHTRGSYWYHPHHHGSADVQVASGMSGMIVVEGDFADVPEIAQARERVLVLQQIVFDARGMIENFETVFPETATRFLAVNGQRQPVITMRPGEVQRWRLLQASHQDNLFVELEKHPLHAIAYDGIPLGSVESQERMLIAPGQRADVLVQAGAPGTYELRALPYDQGHPSPTGPLASLVVAGEPMAMKLPSALPTPPLASIKDSEITGRRKLVFSKTAPEADAAGHYREFRFLIDGKSFDPTRIDQRVRLGAVEEWTVENTDNHDDHIFHIHTNPFEVVKVNGETLAKPVWRDTAVVRNNGGSIVFRSRFLDYTGIFMIHCHMMNHEEMGMMQTVEVYKD